MSLPPPAPGDAVAAIATPALVIDLDALERNIARMAAYAREHGMRLRPHAKTRKCAEIAKRRSPPAPWAMCVQKLSRGAGAGRRRRPTSTSATRSSMPAKLAELAALPARARGSPSRSTRAWASTGLAVAAGMVDVFVEVDVGHGRCGVAPTAPPRWRTRWCRHGLRLPGCRPPRPRQHLRIAGRARARDPPRRESGARAAVKASPRRASPARWSPAPAPAPSCWKASGLYGELQAGSYVFMDRDYVDNHAAPARRAFEHALFVRAR